MANFSWVALLFAILITTFNRGFFTFAGLTFVVTICFLLFLVFKYKTSSKTKTVKNSSGLFKLLLVITYTLFLFFSGGIYQSNFSASLIISTLPILILPIILTYVLAGSQTAAARKKRFIFLIAASFVLRILIIIASPNPIIDVFTILKESPQALLSGSNPYETVYSPVYQGSATDYFPYWPSSFLLQLPFILIFREPRILLLTADILSAILLYLLAKKTLVGEIIALIYIFRPNSLFMIEQSWLTPLSFFLFLGGVFGLTRQKENLALISFGLFYSLQPQNILSLPYLWLFLPKFKFILKILLFTVLLILPFLIWNPGNFIYQTILVYFKPTSQLPTIPVHSSLNLNTLNFILTGKDIPFWTTAVLILGLSIYIFVKVFRLKNRKNIFLVLTLNYYLFYLLFRQAFINYYYFAADLLMLYLVVSMSSPTRSGIQTGFPPSRE